METKIFTTHNKIKERNNSMTKKTLLLLSTVFALNCQVAWGMEDKDEKLLVSPRPKTMPKKLPSQSSEIIFNFQQAYGMEDVKDEKLPLSPRPKTTPKNPPSQSSEINSSMQDMIIQIRLNLSEKDSERFMKQRLYQMALKLCGDLTEQKLKTFHIHIKDTIEMYTSSGEGQNNSKGIFQKALNFLFGTWGNEKLDIHSEYKRFGENYNDIFQYYLNIDS